MKTPRAMLLVFAGLAGGLGARLAFTWPVEKPAARGVGARAARIAEERALQDEVAGPRPDEASVLAAQGGRRLRLLMAWLPGAGEEELLRMAEALTAAKIDDYLGLRLLMARWAEVNPSAMLDWARAGSQGHFSTSWYVNDAIEAWARVDFDKAWAAACAGQPGTRGSALLGLTATDPDKCLRLLRADLPLLDLPGITGISDLFTVHTVMGNVLARIARRDPAGVAALLDSGPAAWRTKFAGDVALAWAKSDPGAAIAWMAKLEPGVRVATLEEAGTWIATHAPGQLPAFLENLPVGRMRSEVEAWGFSHLAATNPAAARRQLDAMPASPSRQYCRGIFLKKLFRSGDEAGALAVASQLGWQFDDDWCPTSSRTEYGHGSSSSSSEDDGVQKAMAELMGRIAARNPQEAAAILAKYEYSAVSEFSGEKESNPAALAGILMATGDQKSLEVCKYLASSWAEHDPAAAAAWAVSNGARGPMLEAIMKRWSSDPSAMLAWAATVDAGAATLAWDQMVMQNHGYVSAHPDEFLAAASPRALEQSLSQGYDDEFQRRVLRQLPDNSTADLLGNTMQRWLQDKPEEASEWVQSLPPSTRRNNAATEIVTHSNSTGDHERAFEWAATLPAETRGYKLVQTIEAWGKTNAAAAASAIRGSALPAEEQQKLLQTLTPP